MEGTEEEDRQKVLAECIKPYFDERVPVVVRGAMAKESTPAMQSWTSLEYLHKTNHDDTASVEIGGSYGNPDVERPDIPFDQYLQYLKMFHSLHGEHGPKEDPWLKGQKTEEDQSALSEPKPDELVYMAQNDLLHNLQKDIQIPEFCRDASYGVGHGKPYSTMMWLGPRQTVSPLHFDPLDNCLMQIVGRKRVVMFSPNTNADYTWHYAGSEGQQKNTSPVDIEASVDHVLKRTFPRFVRWAPPAMYTLLEPGDLLYIPAKWWHHVRSLDTSASVNVWFR